MKYHNCKSTKTKTLEVPKIQSITSDEFAQMVIELFDVWYFHPDARVRESNLIEMCSNIVYSKA